MRRSNSFPGELIDRFGALPSSGLTLHLEVGCDELAFEFFEEGGLALGEVVLLSGIVFEIEELEADELSRLNFREMGFLPA